MKLRYDAKRRFEWEQTAALRAQIYDGLRGKDSQPSCDLPKKYFNPMIKDE